MDRPTHSPLPPSTTSTIVPSPLDPFRHPHRRSLILLSVAVVGWCLLILLGRMWFSSSTQYSFMIWNLFLAAVPLGFSHLVERFEVRGDGKAWKFWGLVALWLLFFPNAPYVVTDFIHLHRKSDGAIPVWYDVAMLGNFSAVALVFGLVSMHQVQVVMRRRIGGMSAGLLVAGCALLAGFGIYLGRFLRWNSWDIITRPWRLMADVLDRFVDPFAHPRTWVFTILFGGTILLLHLLVQAGLKLARGGEGETTLTLDS